MDMFQEDGKHFQFNTTLLTTHFLPRVERVVLTLWRMPAVVKFARGGFLKRKLNQFDWKPFVKLCFLQHVSIFESPLPALLMRTWKITQPSDKIPMPKNLKKSTYTLCYTPKGGYRKQVHSIMLLGLVGYMIDIFQQKRNETIKSSNQRWYKFLT